MGYFLALIAFLIISLINIIFLHNEHKFKKLSIFLSCFVIILAIIFIIILNIDYICRIEKISKYLTEKDINFCINTLKDMNFIFAISSIILCLALFAMSFIKIKYLTLYDISIISIFIVYFILLFWKRYSINKFNIDFIGLALDLRSYYLCIGILPLLIKKSKNNIHI